MLCLCFGVVLCVRFSWVDSCLFIALFFFFSFSLCVVVSEYIYFWREFSVTTVTARFAESYACETQFCFLYFFPLCVCVSCCCCWWWWWLLLLLLLFAAAFCFNVYSLVLPSLMPAKPSFVYFVWTFLFELSFFFVCFCFLRCAKRNCVFFFFFPSPILRVSALKETLFIFIFFELSVYVVFILFVFVLSALLVRTPSSHAVMTTRKVTADDEKAARGFAIFIVFLCIFVLWELGLNWIFWMLFASLLRIIDLHWFVWIEWIDLFSLLCFSCASSCSHFCMMLSLSLSLFSFSLLSLTCLCLLFE